MKKLALLTILAFVSVATLTANAFDFGGLVRNVTKKITVTCSSTGIGDYQECRISGQLIKAKFKKDLSRRRYKCVKGETYGTNILQSYVWVSEGCRAKFVLEGINIAPDTSNQPQKKWYCQVKAFGRIYYGENKTRAVAERQATQQCQARNHAMHCRRVQCTRE